MNKNEFLCQHGNCDALTKNIVVTINQATDDGYKVIERARLCSYAHLEAWAKEQRRHRMSEKVGTCACPSCSVQP